MLHKKIDYENIDLARGSILRAESICRRWTKYFGIVTALLGSLGFLGWKFDLPVLASFRSTYIPMAPLTAILFMAMGSLLFAVSLARWSKSVRVCGFILSTVTILLGFTSAMTQLSRSHFSIESLLFPSIERFGLVPVNRISPITASAFVLAGLAALLLFAIKTPWARSRVITTIGGIISVLGFVGAVGYVKNSPFFYSGTIIPMALTTTLAFGFMGLGLIAAVGPSSYLIRPMVGRGTRARLLRAFLPLILTFSAIELVLNEISRGTLNFKLIHKVALIDTIFVVLTVAIVWRVARKVGNIIDQEKTGRKQAEKDREESERLYRTLIETTLEGVWVIDAQFRTVYVNRRTVELLGYSEAEFVGRHPAEFMVEADRAEFYERLERRKAGAKEAYERRFLHKDGKTVVHCRISGSPRFDESGRFIGSFAMVSDVTELRAMEARARHSQKMEAIGQLAGGVAHDFNNILAGIIGYAEISRDDAPPGSALETSLNRILSAAHRAKHLVMQILTFSRRTSIEKKEVQLRAVVEEVIELLRASLPSSVSILAQLDRDSCVLADPTKIHEVIMNLCTNAVYAMKEKGELYIRLDEKEIRESWHGRLGSSQPGRYALITVKDTGSGMTEAVLEKIFDPFFTTKPVGEGTGMGLSVIHGIVQAFGGNIQVESCPGAGTNFTIALPRVEAKLASSSAVTTVPAVAAAGKDRAALASEGTERVLVVDDEELLVDLIRRQLSSRGYRVTATSNSSEALELIRKNPAGFDVLVTDQTMPGMTGIELSKQVKAIRPDLPIVLCTGRLDVECEDLKAFGVTKTLAKPMSAHELMTTIREAISLQGSVERIDARQPLRSG